jgi:hypothetical protein
MSLCVVSLLASSGLGLAADPVKVTLQAAIVQGAKALKDDIAWSISPTNKDGTPRQQVTKAAPELQLAPGRYHVTATLGHATVSKDINVSAAGTHELVFDAGYARFDMIPTQKAKPLQENVQWQIYRYAKGGVDESRKVAELVGPKVQLTLPEGWYTVRARYQGIVQETVAEVKAGILYKYTLVGYAGKVKLAAVDGSGKAVKKDIVWTIERVSKNGGKRQPLTTDQTASPDLLIAEGNYVVVARSGNLVGEAPFDIKAAREKKVTVKLQPAGTATAASGG